VMVLVPFPDETIAPSSRVEQPLRGYPIAVGIGALKYLTELCAAHGWTKAHGVVDSKLEHVWESLVKPLITVPASASILSATEGQKTMTTASQLVSNFMRESLDRRSVIINLGGGLIGDIGGFAASIFMRGINFVQIPTTLLAQVDASVGGKVGANVDGIKNIVGSFAQPSAVIADSSLLESLPERELRSGYAEVIKHAVITDESLFNELKDNISRYQEPEYLAALVERNVRIKSRIVTLDPFEQGLRQILNAGHTVGHAIESVASDSKQPLLHGECVAIGLVVESQIATTLGIISDSKAAQIEELISAYQLPTRIPTNLDIERMITAVAHDKKNRGGTIVCALPSSIGSCSHSVPIEPELLRTVLYECRTP
jgi:3-dehydroquinate synthase